MSVYIKGMEMPIMPEVRVQGGIVPFVDVRIFADGTAVISKGERPYFNEYIVIEVPPHGRLIDADEFAAQFVVALPDMLDKLFDQRKRPEVVAQVQALLMDIAEAPTIIEAEGRNE